MWSLLAGAAVEFHQVELDIRGRPNFSFGAGCGEMSTFGRHSVSAESKSSHIWFRHGVSCTFCGYRKKVAEPEIDKSKRSDSSARIP